MEKIQSVEQLDALGAKICELLQVGIDKANTVVPETLQQIVAWQMWSSFGELAILSLLIAFSFFGFLFIAIKRKELGEEFIFVGLCMDFILSIILISALIFRTVPSLFKVFVAPNLVIIEQLGGLVK